MAFPFSHFPFSPFIALLFLKWTYSLWMTIPFMELQFLCSEWLSYISFCNRFIFLFFYVCVWAVDVTYTWPRKSIYDRFTHDQIISILFIYIIPKFTKLPWIYPVLVVAGRLAPQGLGPHGESLGLGHGRFLGYKKKSPNYCSRRCKLKITLFRIFTTRTKVILNKKCILDKVAWQNLIRIAESEHLKWFIRERFFLNDVDFHWNVSSFLL